MDLLNKIMPITEEEALEKEINATKEILNDLTDLGKSIMTRVIESNSKYQLYVTQDQNEFQFLDELGNIGLINVRESERGLERSVWITSKIKNLEEFESVKDFVVPGRRWMWKAQWVVINNGVQGLPVLKEGIIIALPYEDKFSLYKRLKRTVVKDTIITNRGEALLTNIDLFENEQVF